MKKRILMLSLLFFLSFSLFAQEQETWWGSYYRPGNVAVKAAVGLEASPDYSGYLLLGVYPQVEIMLYKPALGGFAPLDIGIAVKGRVGLGTGDSGPAENVTAGLGALGVIHFGFRGIGSSSGASLVPGFFSHMGRIDYFFGIGPVFDLIVFDDYSPIGLGTTTGANYFISEHLALTLEANWWNGFRGGALGAAIKIGPSPVVKKLEMDLKTPEVDLKPMYMQAYLAQFYSLYWYSFYIGGFYFDDSSYREGQGTRWKITSNDDPDALIIDKSLLKVNTDGSRWWKIIYSSGEDQFLYEFLVDKDYNLLKLRFVDDDGTVQEYSPEPEDLEAYTSTEMREISEADYRRWNTGQVTVRTEAGSFKTDHLIYTEAEAQHSFEWWISQEVPGGLVKYLWKSSDDTMTGLLTEITSGNRSELNSF